jgi:hypothetical protein
MPVKNLLKAFIVVCSDDYYTVTNLVTGKLCV